MPDVVQCPACTHCYEECELSKGPHVINGTHACVCMLCDMHHFHTGSLPQPSRCDSSGGICCCLDTYMQKKGIMLPTGHIKAGYCHHCYGTLVPIGTARANGKRTHDDWPRREYHKKCWTELQEE